MRIFILLFTLFFSSCSNGLLPQLSRRACDPQIEDPQVICFSDEFLIKVQWPDDDCADEYALYRALDTDENYKLVYQGVKAEYLDRDIESEVRYLYRLFKIRGNRRFGPSSSRLGVGSATRTDDYEPNNSRDTATSFEYTVVANSFYYVSHSKAQSLMDTDWYSVDVRPRSVAEFKVNVPSVASNQPTGLKLYQHPNLPEIIINNKTLSIENQSYTKKRFYFSIYPDGASIVTGPHGGGHVIPYTLTLVQEHSL